jgi:transcriptional regulator with XRE-family HTH domain
LRPAGGIAIADETGIVELVARRVRAWRKALGLSQEALAHEAGIDRTYVSQVERRMRNLTITMLVRLAQALGTTADRLRVDDEGSGVDTRATRRRRS